MPSEAQRPCVCSRMRTREESRDQHEHRYVEHDPSPSERIAEQPRIALLPLDQQQDHARGRADSAQPLPSGKPTELRDDVGRERCGEKQHKQRDEYRREVREQVRLVERDETMEHEADDDTDESGAPHRQQDRNRHLGPGDTDRDEVRPAAGRRAVHRDVQRLGKFVEVEVAATDGRREERVIELGEGREEVEDDQDPTTERHEDCGGPISRSDREQGQQEGDVDKRDDDPVTSRRQGLRARASPGRAPRGRPATEATEVAR